MTKPKVTIKVDTERIQDKVTVDELIAMQEGDIKTIVNVMSNFVWNVGKGVYYSFKAGREHIGKLTLRQLNELKRDFFGKTDDQSVPKDKSSE